MLRLLAAILFALALTCLHGCGAGDGATVRSAPMDALSDPNGDAIVAVAAGERLLVQLEAAAARTHHASLRGPDGTMLGVARSDSPRTFFETTPLERGGEVLINVHRLPHNRPQDSRATDWQPLPLIERDALTPESLRWRLVFASPADDDGESAIVYVRRVPPPSR